MKVPVKLYLRVRLPAGSYPYLAAAYASNGRLRPTPRFNMRELFTFPIRPTAFGISAAGVVYGSPSATIRPLR